ncbi:hypothetical protein MXD58_022955, partial [Frankia sp. AgKG'84/4]
IGSPSPPGAVERAAEMIMACGALAVAEERIAADTAAALAALAACDVDATTRDALTGLAIAATARAQ